MAPRHFQLSKVNARDTIVHAILEQAGEGYFANPTLLMPMAPRKSALGNLVGSVSSIEHNRCLASREGLESPISFKISTTRSDPEAAGDESLAIFDFRYEARRLPEEPLPLPL